MVDHPRFAEKGSLNVRLDPTVPCPIGKVDHEADREPDRQPPPCVGRKAEHQENRGCCSSRRDDPDGRRLERAIEVWLGDTQHQDAEGYDRKCEQRSDTDEFADQADRQQRG